MAAQSSKKRSRDDSVKSKVPRPSKKQKQKQLDNYHSSESEDDDQDGFQAVNLLDSDDEDLHNAMVDDVAPSNSDSELGSEDEGTVVAKKTKKNERQKQNAKKIGKPAPARDAPDSEEDEDSDEDENDSFSDLGSDDEDEDGPSGGRQSARTKSKRNDPSAFATSLSKILSTKLSTSRRADPVLARSADAHEASRQAADSALEAKARKQLREQKRTAKEKGRVRDVLVATNAVAPTSSAAASGASQGQQDGWGATTAEMMETERRLRKTAQRGVVKLFNAVRAAQVKAAEAERTARAEGMVGMGRREEKVTEMSRKGFLDLIASGGGKPKKAALEEA